MCIKYASTNTGFPPLGEAPKVPLFSAGEFRRKRFSDDNKHPGHNQNGFYKAAPTPCGEWGRRRGFKKSVDLRMSMFPDETSLASLGHRVVAL